MSWIKLDDRFAEHPKIVGLSDRALRIHIAALCYAARNNTDGRVPATLLRSFGGAPRHAQELIAAGVWSENGEGWAIHDFLEYNISRQERVKLSRAGRRGAKKRWLAARTKGG